MRERRAPAARPRAGCSQRRLPALRACPSSTSARARANSSESMPGKRNANRRTPRLARSSRSGSPASLRFLVPNPSDLLFSPRGLRERAKGSTKGGRSMSTHSPTGFNWAEALQPLEARRRARVVASFAEYLAEDVHGNPDRALEAVVSLAEWWDGDPQLVGQAPGDALRGTHRATPGAQAGVRP